jgi:prepilin peptidase CpaA
MSPASLGVPAATITVGVLVAAVTDLWKFKVHNVLTLPLVLSGLLYHWLGEGLPGLAASVVGATFGFLVFFPFYLRGGIGGGDVKLMAAVGAWLGLPLTFFVFIVSSLAAGVYAVVLIIAHGSWRRTLVKLQAAGSPLAARGQHLGAEDRVEVAVSAAERRKNCIPFAAMVAVGVIGTLAWLLLEHA